MNAKEIQQKLLEKNTLYLGGKIDGDMADYVGMAIAELISRGAPPITVNITSGGGRVTAGLAIYDMLSTYPNKVSGVVIAFSRSMASVILQACTTRAAQAHSRILIHHISTSDVTLDVMRNEKKRKEFQAGMEKDQAFLYNILSKRSGQPVKVIRRKCKENEDMTAEEALKFGLVDSIVPVRPLEEMEFVTVTK